MTNDSLARAYLTKAEKRLLILDVLHGVEAYSDVVREAQEIVELATKGMLHAVGIDPPKWHDVGGLLVEYRDKFPPAVAAELDDVALVSRRLRKERELAFYGDVDFIPTEAYTADDSMRAIREAGMVVALARRSIAELDNA